MNRPVTAECRVLWSAVIGRAFGQVRMMATERGGVAIGLDMGALLAMARAAGVAPVLALDMLTSVEPTILEQLNARGSSEDD